MKNLVDQYVEYTQKSLKKYFKFILVGKYDANIINEYIKTYINARYYNEVDDESTKAFYLKILDKINEKCQKIKQENEQKKSTVIEAIKLMFNYVLFWDKVRNAKNVKSINNIRTTVEKISEIRKDMLKLENQENFESTLHQMIKEDILKKEIFLDNMESDKFIIQLEKSKKNKNIYFADMDFNIKMPIEYSSEIIDKVYSEGIVAEDKLKVEYSLLSLIVLRDIITGNFNDVYISEFPPSLLKKKQKMDTLLGFINNQVLQDKIYLTIKYENFVVNRALIMEYIKQGINFAIYLDDYITDVEDIERLKIFKILLMDKKTKLYNEIKKQNYSNVVEI